MPNPSNLACPELQRFAIPVFWPNSNLGTLLVDRITRQIYSHTFADPCLLEVFFEQLHTTRSLNRSGSTPQVFPVH